MLKHAALLLLLAVSVFGCDPAPVNPPAPAPKVENPPPAKPITSEPTKEEPEAQDPSFNAKRVYQLKDLKAETFKVNGKEIKVWIMDDDGKREEGMMWLTEKEVKDNEGMLFVFSNSEPRTFWMQNTVLPLDIAYIDPKGKVLNVAKGKSYDETGLPSKGSAQYVLELKQGQAEKFGIKAGTVLDLPKVKAEN